MEPKHGTIDVQSFATTQLRLLEQELQAELEETSSLLSKTFPASLQRAGFAVTNLVLNSQRTGLGGKTVIEFGPDPATTTGAGELPEHGIRTGDIVLVSEQHSGSANKKEVKDLEAKGSRGVVTRVSQHAVYVALDFDDDDNVASMKRIWAVKLANDVTYKRMKQSMEKLQKMKPEDYTSLMRVLFGLTTPSPLDVEAECDGGIQWVDTSLNESQKEALKVSLAARELALIWGPPGTGKTHTLIELILQLLKRNLRVLVCGPSNISVDNIVERLAPHKVQMVRLGHVARLLPSVLNHSLDVLTQTSDAAAIVKDVRKDMDSKQASIRKTKSGKERKVIYGDLKELRKEFRMRENRCISEITSHSKVILATLHGAGGFQLRDETFDCVIIDEASQSLECQCWVPLLQAKKVILAGDHLQLPPTIKSLNSKSKLNPKNAAENLIKGMSLELTLFERMVAMHPSLKRMLTTQYRMHEAIMRHPSDELYESKLVAADGTYRLLQDLPYEVHETDDTSDPLIFFDTQGGEFPEKDEAELSERHVKGRASLSESKSNDNEALLVKLHVSNLVRAGVKAEDIAVITPYNAQVALLTASLKDAYPGIEVGSVDGFQGREKECVIVSLVRSNAEHEVGFLGEKRRLNVAMTRPRRNLTVIGDSETVSKGSTFLGRWMQHLEDNTDLRYPSVTSLNTG